MNLSFKIIALVAVYVEAQEILEELKSHQNWNLIDHGTNCGQGKPTSRIMGGQDASMGQFPWIAHIGTTPLRQYAHPVFSCGGSIINDRYVVTAAHCITDPIPRIIVRLGDHDTDTNPDCDVNYVCAPNVQDIKVEESVCHPDYNDTNLRNDICLLRLSDPIQFNNFVKPICLPSYDQFKDNTFEGLKMDVAGWGVTGDTETNTFASVLRTLKVPVVSLSVCQSDTAYADVGQMIPQQMCAGGVVGEDSCDGDSGSPLMHPFDYGGPARYFIIGIVSMGACGTNTPAIYTKVPDYMKWILDSIKE